MLALIICQELPVRLPRAWLSSPQVPVPDSVLDSLKKGEKSGRQRILDPDRRLPRRPPAGLAWLRSLKEPLPPPPQGKAMSPGPTARDNVRASERAEPVSTGSQSKQLDIPSSGRGLP